MFSLGFLFTIDGILDVIGIQYRFLGAILQLIGMGIISYFFISLPSFSEFDWKDKIEDVFLMDSAGICLLRKSFKDKSDLVDEKLVAGAVSSINVMLKELTSAKERQVSIIKKKDKIVIIFPSEIISGIIFCKEDLNYVRVILAKFVHKFEAIYHDVLLSWDGNLSIFKHTENIFNEIFSN